MSGRWIQRHPTGERRFRRGLFGKMILQIRERATYEADMEPPYGDRSPMHGKTGTRWRDATIEDLTVEEKPQ